MRYTDYAEINKCKALLRNCSYDGYHGEWMTDSELMVINFDYVKTEYLNKRGYTEEKARSVDVLANGLDDQTYLIEFKNGDVSKQKTQVLLKLKDSILLLCDICHCHISDTRESIIFVLVYNDERSNLSWETKRYLGYVTLSGHPVVFGDLEKAEGFIIRKVYMVTKEQFGTKLLPKLKGL